MDYTVDINVGSGYSVNIGAGLLDSCGSILAGAVKPCKAAVVTDSVVSELYLDRAMKSLKSAGFSPVSYVFPNGEGSKNISTISDMLEFFASKQLTRSDLVVALGGGVTGDMSGFAAGIYMRGIKYAQIPTTLLADVDSSVGGKTAVNLSAGKNLAGVFLQPVSVVCDTEVLKTLTPEIFADGAAESIKYGVLTDESLFKLFESGNVLDSLPDIISRCVAIKGALVERDEHDNGDRRFLNLGHTIGHAIENLSGYTFPHGHAVAVGMVMISRAGEKLGITEPGTAERIADVLKKNNLPVSVDYSAESLLPAALSDKKRNGGEVTIVVPEKIGKCILKTIPVTELGDIIKLGKEQ
jgi:3-dehydroquinate synthase